MIRKLRCLLAILALVSFTAPAIAAQTALEANQAQIGKIENYLNGIKTMKARFTQTGPDGQTLAGIFYLSRPGKLRFEYDAPVTDFIVADGIFIYFYDGQMGEQSNMPISNSLADFFLRKKLDLSGDIMVSEFKKKNSLWQLTLAQSVDPAAGSITLFLTPEPLALKKWTVVDAQGLKTTIELTEIEPGIRLKDNLFYYHDPELKIPNFNK